MAVLTRYGQFIALAFAALITLSVPALAQDLSPVNTMLGNIGNALTGATGRALGLVALAAVGIAFLIGRMNWMLAISVVVGLAILFGACTMLDGFA